MRSSLTSSRALWTSLALCAVAAILAPLFVSVPEIPAVTNPTVAEIRAECEALAPWFTLYDEATALRAQLERPDSGSANEQLQSFTEKTAAERAFHAWVRTHRPRTLEAVDRDEHGSGLLRSYRDSLIKSHRALETQKAIVNAKKELITVIQRIREGILTKGTNSGAIESVSARFQSLRRSVIEQSCHTASIETTVDAQINREFHRLREP